MERVEGWAARTDRPLGSIPLVTGALIAAVVANVFTSTGALVAAAWAAFAIFAAVLAARGVRWLMRQMEAVQIERETDQLLDRQPRLVPLFHPPRWDHGEYHKAS